MKSGSAIAALFNLSALLFFIPLLIMVGIALFFILNSPAGTPFFKKAAAYFLKKERFAWAAYCYEKLYHFQLLLGNSKEYGRQAAFCYEQLLQIPEALSWYIKIEDWGKVGQLYMDTGKFEKAEAIFSDYKMFNRLAYCYERQHKYMELGDLYETRLGNPQKALRFYEKALEKTPATTEQLAELQLRIIRTCLQLNRTAEAQQKWQELSTLFQAKPHFASHPTLKKLGTEVKAMLKSDAQT